MSRFVLYIIIFISVTSLFANVSNGFELESTTSEKMNKLINDEKEKYKLLYFFTTWCYECNESLDQISKMQLDHKLSKKYHFINISLDDNFKKLENYSKNNEKNKSKIYYFKLQEEIGKFFVNTKINYDNAVPYYCILDHNNNVIIEGYFELGDIEKYLK